ncbi:hypothetical protein AXG93_1054s1540 [Marchantia polymorpha subsp. ruderalis]|uniref:Uncharacterized protein n=1 Tax=Marchantia polymorpha subsp. ruderalis TaxID=1480154 RepID=A0A176WMI9_MARPO|nr:hypothetical protein AXG93_1054s1540 [Marchantia polymorpha subsp. ruderalis]
MRRMVVGTALLSSEVARNLVQLVSGNATPLSDSGHAMPVPSKGKNLQIRGRQRGESSGDGVGRRALIPQLHSRTVLLDGVHMKHLPSSAVPAQRLPDLRLGFGAHERLRSGLISGARDPRIAGRLFSSPLRSESEADSRNMEPSEEGQRWIRGRVRREVQNKFMALPAGSFTPVQHLSGGSRANHSTSFVVHVSQAEEKEAKKARAAESPGSTARCVRQDPCRLLTTAAASASSCSCTALHYCTSAATTVLIGSVSCSVSGLPSFLPSLLVCLLACFLAHC